jgi:hypothetical protein
VVTTIALSLLALPLAGLAIMFFAMGLANHDTSGQGGPFRSCSASSTQCDGGNPLFVIGAALVLAGSTAVIAWIGHRVGGFRRLRIGWSAMAAIVIVVISAAMVIIWSVVTAPR